MVVVGSYPTAVILCIVTMLCWGSWANTQKLASQEWRFQLFYWDYSIGVVLLALIMAFTLGSTGTAGRSFLADLTQAAPKWLGSAFLGGVIFNLSNIGAGLLTRSAGAAAKSPSKIEVSLNDLVGTISPDLYGYLLEDL